VIAELVNEPPADVAALAERVGAPALIVHHFIDELRDQGLLNCSHYMGGGARIHNISPALRRLD
jgi:DNA-binding IscR family transcriptional regulator